MKEPSRFIKTKDIRAAVGGRETDILDALKILWRTGHPHIQCPYPDHPDKHPSWRWDERKARAFCACDGKGHDVFEVLKRVEKCDFETAKLRAAEIIGRRDLIRETSGGPRSIDVKLPLTAEGRGEGGMSYPSETPSTVQHCGCTLSSYAEAKRLPVAFLQSIGLSEITYQGTPAVRIPYFAEDGSEAAVRFRIADDGKDKFRWRSGNRACIYGLNRLGAAREAGAITLVEGESDCHTLWHAGCQAVGLPGAKTWQEDRDAALLDGFTAIYVVVEPDKGGEAVLKWLARSRIRERVRLVRPEGFKDPSALYVDDPTRFAERWKAALDTAVPWLEEAAREAKDAKAAAWESCKALAHEPDILDKVAQTLKACGLVGEERGIKLVYLALTSRLLPKIVSLAVKGPSSGGKSFLVAKVLSLFPPDAVRVLTAASERALVYGEEPIAHKIIVLFEAAGLMSDFGTYIVRSLLSEGCICYETVERSKDGMRHRRIEREGPTGLIVTTTAAQLHPENETRLLSITITDTAEQTRAILRGQAQRQRRPDTLNLEPWHALHKFIALGPTRVEIPFASELVELIPPLAVRLRRDFPAVLSLIEANALLHQVHRERASDGAIMATIEDYRAVHGLVADLVSDGVGATVPATVRETVNAVAELTGGTVNVVSVGAVAKKLALDKSPASRRVKEAIARGFLRNEEVRKGRPAQLVLDDPLPDELEILPAPQRVADRCGVASVASVSEGLQTPLPL